VESADKAMKLRGRLVPAPVYCHCCADYLRRLLQGCWTRTLTTTVALWYLSASRIVMERPVRALRPEMAMMRLGTSYTTLTALFDEVKKMSGSEVSDPEALTLRCAEWDGVAGGSALRILDLCEHPRRIGASDHRGISKAYRHTIAKELPHPRKDEVVERDAHIEGERKGVGSPTSRESSHQ
jgi:hypothetical protein